MMESRGNRKLFEGDTNVGVEQVGSTVHYGPFWGVQTYDTFKKNSEPDQGFNNDFHRYQLEWTPDKLTFKVDDEVIGEVAPPDGGFWEKAGFNQFPGIENPWRDDSKIAPFDREFYFIFNVAAGGTNGYFPDGLRNEGADKPWSNGSPTAMRDFWQAHNDWLQTWKLDENFSEEASMQIDYVRVWAL